MTKSKTKLKNSESPLKSLHNAVNLRKSHQKSDEAMSSARGNIAASYDIFPWYCPYVIFAVTLIIRIYHVSQPSNWWILHPDEVFQSLEVAHSQVYGYGFRPYEYLTSEPNDNTTRLRYREMSLGMSAMRSFIYPVFFVVLTRAAEIFTQEIKPFLLWKVGHGFVTSFLPISIYKFTRDVFDSRDIGVMSSLLVATSVHLNVFGTHTLVNSFLAPFVFMALSVILGIISNSKIKDSGQEEISGVTNGDTMTINGSVQGATQHKSDNISWGKRLTVSFESTIPNLNRFQSMSMNCEILLNGILGLKRVKERVPQVVKISYHVPVNAFWKSWTFVSYHLLVAVSSFVLTTACYIRPDLTLFSVTVLLPFISIQSVTVSNILEILTGIISSVILCVWFDFKMFGFGIITPWNWFHFNVLTDYSAAFFGKMSVSFYTNAMFIQCYFNSVLIILAVILLAYMKVTCTLKNSGKVVKLFLSFCVLLVSYSLQSHKETRHIHNLFCLFFILVSWALIQFSKSILSMRASRIMISSLCVLSLFNCFQRFPSAKDHSNASWTYAHTSDSNDVNICLDYVGSTKDVNGVFLDRSIHMAGGYTILHRNIPILALMINEFNEFDHPSRTEVASHVPWSSKDVRVSTFSRVSNFISVSNSPYLLRYLIQNPKYNYLILKENRRFIKYGFVEVFRSGGMKVLKRIFEADEEEKLYNTAERIGIGSNATVLNHEGNMLFDLGCYDQAIERLEASLKLNPSLVNTYQLLSNLYFIQGKKKMAESVIRSCFKKVDKQSCMTL